MHKPQLSERHRRIFLRGVRGGDETSTNVVTVADLRDERARSLTAIDEILDAAQARPEAERSLTDQEREDHDLHVLRVAELDSEITRATQAEDDEARFAAREIRRSAPAPMVNRISTPPASAEHSLDELLWATEDAVRAGTFDRAGNIRPSAAMNPVEQVIVRSDAEAQGVQAPRIGEFIPDQRPAIKQFQRTVARMALFGMLVDNDAKSSRRGFEVARSHRAMQGEWQQVCRALDVDTSGEGADWVPTGIGASLHEKVRAVGKVGPLFTRVDMPTNPWKWPVEGADATAYRVGEPTGDTESKPTASTPGTVAATFDAEIFGARTIFSRSLDADSAIAILPFAERKLAQAFVNAEERAILDGDADGTHQDTDTHALGATDAAWAWDGLRKKALAQTVATATTCTALNLGIVRKAMGKWGVNPADLAFIIGVSNLHALLADTNLLTVDKMGPQATVLNGQLGSVFGVPVIVSEYVREDLNASGIDDGITATKTYMLCVNRNEFAIGQRMALDVEVDDSIYRETFQRVVVAFQREDFQHIGAAATDDNVAIAYNVTP